MARLLNVLAKNGIKVAPNLRRRNGTQEFLQDGGSSGCIDGSTGGKVAKVRLLGTDAKVTWRQTDAVLSVTLPTEYLPVVNYAAALKIEFV